MNKETTVSNKEQSARLHTSNIEAHASKDGAPDLFIVTSTWLVSNRGFSLCQKKDVKAMNNGKSNSARAEGSSCLSTSSHEAQHKGHREVDPVH